MSIIHWIGVDDHADRWTVSHLEGSGEKPTKVFELIPTDAGYRKLIGYCKGLLGEVRIVYEAGPCGYELYRRLKKSGLECQVAAPTLTPRKPGDRVKTNRRDATKLAHYLRSGDLTMISVPDEGREALRDLVRARQTAKSDLNSNRNQITKLLLRYGHRYREGDAWTRRFSIWLGKITLPSEDSQRVLDEMLLTLKERLARLARFDQMIEDAANKPEHAAYVAGLKVLRGINTLSAMVILSEMGDLRRFATAPQLMAALGLVPGEHSTGEQTTRLSITKTGNAHVRHVLVEASWHYTRRLTNGARVRARRKGQPPPLLEIAEKCELRLNRKFYRMTGRRKKSTVAVVAVARELAGFVWAIGQVVHP